MLNSSRFQYHYDNTLSYDLAEKLGVDNAYEVPKLEKIILSSSVSFKPQQMRGVQTGESTMGPLRSNDKKTGSSVSKGSGKKRPGVAGQGLQDCTLQVRKALMLLSGQSLDPKTFRVARPHLGIREGRLAAYQVTLRDEAMYSFLERLLIEVIPKVMKTDLATLVTGSSDRRLQQSSVKLANFRIGKPQRIPSSA
jgi:ribosomal protein L5